MERGEPLSRHSRKTAYAAAVIAFLLLICSPALAQEPAQQPARLEVFAGASYLRFDSKVIGFADKSDMYGFNGAASYRLFKTISVVADVSGHYGTEIQLYNFLIGPQISYPMGKMTYFGRFLYGKARNHVDALGGETSIGRVLDLGGGVDRNLGSRFAVRLVQVDYMNTHTFQTNESNLRVSTGLVYHWGK
jgi:hypothetical protein